MLDTISAEMGVSERNVRKNIKAPKEAGIMNALALQKPGAGS
jgi:predicted transcriptional regulator